MEPAIAANESQPGRWRFSMRTMLLATVLIAVGLLDFRLTDTSADTDGSWSDVLNAAVYSAWTPLALWAAVGLGMQIHDLCRFAKAANATAELRWGIRFAIFWRSAALITLVGSHAWDRLARAWPELRLETGLSMLSGLDTILPLAFIAAISGIRFSGPTSRPRFRRWQLLLVVLLGIPAVSYVAYDQQVIIYLVAKAIRGFTPPVGLISPTETAIVLGIGTVGLIPLVLFCLRRAALGAGKSGSQRRWVCFAVAWSLMAGLLTANLLVYFPATAPFLLGQGFEVSLAVFLGIGLPCVLALSLAAAYRWTATPVEGLEEPSGSEFRWRTPYTHERIAFLTATTLLLCMQSIYVALMLAELNNSPYVVWTWKDTTTFFISPFFAVYTALLVLAPARLIQGIRGSSLPPAIRPLPIRRFLWVTIAAVATLVVAVPVLALYGFALVAIFGY